MVGGDVRWKWWVEMVGDMMGEHGGWTWRVNMVG